DDEGLATAGVTGDENTRLARLVIAVTFDVSAVVERHAELRCKRIRFRTGEAEREQNEVGWDLPFGTALRNATAVEEFGFGDADRTHFARLVGEELDGRHEVLPFAALLVRALHLEQRRHHRPRLRVGPRR